MNHLRVMKNISDVEEYLTRVKPIINLTISEIKRLEEGKSGSFNFDLGPVRNLTGGFCSIISNDSSVQKEHLLQKVIDGHSQLELENSYFMKSVLANIIFEIAFMAIKNLDYSISNIALQDKASLLNKYTDNYKYDPCGNENKIKKLRKDKVWASKSNINGVPIGLIIYAARNQHAHFDEIDLKDKLNINTIKAIGLTMESELSISYEALKLLGWKSYNKVFSDVMSVCADVIE